MTSGSTSPMSTAPPAAGGLPARVGLFIDEAATGAAHQEGRDAWWLAAQEFLDHLRLDHRRFTTVTAADLQDCDVAVLAGPARLDAAAVAAASGWVAAGGCLISDPHPELAELAGVRAGEPFADSQVEIGSQQRMSAAPPRPLHAVTGQTLTVPDGQPEIETIARLVDGAAVITRRATGAGAVIIFGVDLWQTVVSIQQGRFVAADGKPAADGTAPIDDDILKCEDGLVLDFEADRALPPGYPPLPSDYTHSYPPPAAVPIFDQPQADQWWITLAQLIWTERDRRRTASAWLNYWPAGVAAIAHMSHDSDLNNPDEGQGALDAFAEAGVTVTWCQCFPGGYGPEIYTKITEAGHEHALHYNAMGDADLASWGWPQFRAQYAWAQAVTGSEKIIANKNHYTRWEGRTEFYHWCERVGIEIDESRGPSKQGSVGFTFGTAHVSFPMGDVDVANRPMNVLNLPLHTQDLAWAGHLSVRDPILDGAAAVHGIAHFLFHGPHLHGKPATRAACLELAELARQREMPWWTAGKINNWERGRRGVDLELVEIADGWQLTVTARQPIEQAGVLLQLPTGTEVTVEDSGATLTPVVRHGHDFVELAADLPAGTSTWRLVRS
ncbi:hypothetical protein [Microlunatus soli]|uniref:Uncharacterized protein n=1 Tax=Microlunatus soli TaxID=630515 RepID=A0A1H1USW6_9ACTN|nr:hypothetical protein [Microlunatus soli]SDS75573.1 hypothetical protein SAMN04489812_2918 [Microlunatus soli]